MKQAVCPKCQNDTFKRINIDIVKIYDQNEDCLTDETIDTENSYSYFCTKCKAEVTEEEMKLIDDEEQE